jgi:hypothetical protein
MGVQSEGRFNFGNCGTPNLEFWEKCHLGVAPVVNHKKYYKGEGGGFPQVWAVVNLVSLCILVIRSCTKNVPIMH